MYGRYLLDEGRYAEAYPYLETAAARGDAAACEARSACASRWSAQLRIEACAALAAGKDTEALALLVRAYDLAPTPETTGLLCATDDRLRTIDDGMAGLVRLLADEDWPEALGLGIALLRTAPHDGRLHALCLEARERNRAGAARRAAESLDAGLAEEAASALGDNDALYARLVLPAPDDPEYVMRISFPHWYRRGLPWERECAAPPSLEEAQLRETVARAVDTERLLARFGGALAEQRLLDAAAALSTARRIAPHAADFPLRVRQARERLDAAADQALDAAFLSGDIRRALTLFCETHLGPIQVAEERRAQFETRLRNLLAQKLKQHLTENMAANALLLLGSARAVFPDMWADSERKARVSFLAGSPAITVEGEGAAEITAWLRDAHLPLGDGHAVLKVEAGMPELALAESPPSVGIEEKEVPTDLERRPHPAHAGLLAEIALAGTAAAAAVEPEDPWERDARQRKAAFFNDRRQQLARQLECLPAYSYHFEWKKVHVSVVYHQVKAELRVRLALCPAFGAAEAPVETLAVSRSYTAQAPPGIDPYSRGYFPSKDAMKAELGTLLSRKARELIQARFDAALKGMVKEAVKRAGEGDGEGAVEMLAHVYVTQGEGLTAYKDAEALLAHTWGRAQVESLLAAPADGLAEKPVK